MNNNILLINLGSPNSLNLNDIKIFLNQFLSDDLVIDLPKPIQQTILKLFILPFRPKKTRDAYKKIWQPEGSPLIINTYKIAKSLKEKTGWNIKVAMRYQEPSFKKIINYYKINNIKKIIVVPLYPHNAISTTLSTKIELNSIIKKIYPELKIKIIKPFYNHPLYIRALSYTIKPYIDKIDKLMFSYHGIPERHLIKGDNTKKHCLQSINCCAENCIQSNNCYKSNVLTTSKLCAKELELPQQKWMSSFQSRVSIIGSKWLNPYTDIELKKLPQSGIKNIAVICPSFVADCLETLEEINIRGKNDFLSNGGSKFYYIPCLNNNNFFIEALENIINQYNT